MWSENYHERHEPHVAAIYPRGIHGAIAEGLTGEGFSSVATATQNQDEHGLSRDVLATTDVLFWWGHIRQHLVDDHIVDGVVQHVHNGMGLVVLHSGMGSKVFRKLMGTTCEIDGWRHGGRELVWTASPAHPIAAGIPAPLIVPQGEMYSEPFDVPHPDDVVFINSYEGGEVFRSGMTFLRGLGRIFYFAPGHEEYPVYLQPEVRRVLANAAHWAAATRGARALPGAAHRDYGWFERSPDEGAY